VTAALLATSVSLLLVWLYPFVIYPVVLQILPRVWTGSSEERRQSGYSVAMLFCAYNEESSIPAKIENIRAIKKLVPRIQVLAYTDCCTDGTISLLREASDVVDLHEGRERTGKAFGMAQLVSSTEAEIVIFTDANVMVDPESIDRLLGYFDAPEIGTVAGTLKYTNASEGNVARIGAVYWRLEEYIKRMESRTGSTMGADGSIFAMRRELYPQVPFDLLDDMIASISPLFDGYRVITAPDVYAFERAPTDSSDELRRKRRIACRAFNTHRYLAPRLRSMAPLDKFKYFSHKYLRWFSAAFLSSGLLLGFFTIALRYGLTIASVLSFAGLALMLAGYFYKVPILGAIAEVVIGMFAVGVGVIDAMRGRKYQLWDPAKSRN
jgi:cellulose synthase/poly-beta-1,6-N-acetylglucosamine synthase-like glycosyltransferase